MGWRISEVPEDDGCRVLEHEAVEADVLLLDLDLRCLRDAPDRSTATRILKGLVKAAIGRSSFPPIATEDMDSIRAAVGGEPFQPVMSRRR